ncbi:MAG: hypothetical protein ABSA16_11260 [Thermoguttaceae bacterium]|jgi:hypothetical protein
MKCETCEHDFPDLSVKVWNGKKVCPNCFQTLTKLPIKATESKVPISPIEPSFRINPAAYIDIYVSGPKSPWFDSKTDLFALVKIVSESGNREISASETRKWGVFLIKQIKARIAKILAEDLNMPITDDQAFNIAGNYLSGVHSASGARMEVELCDYVQLTQAERNIAEEIGYHAWKAFTAKDKKPPTEQQLRLLTREAIALGENRYCKDWKSAFDSVLQMALDSAYTESARAVSNYMTLAQNHTFITCIHELLGINK